MIYKTLLLLILLTLSACNEQTPAKPVLENNQRAKVIRLKHQQSHPNQRIALVIGNGAYAKKEDFLPNPPNDADDMAKVLKQVGFEVMLSKNISLEAMENAIEDFGEKLNKGGTGLFYFAGHGVQYQGENYLFPIGAMDSVTTPRHLRYKTVNVNYILGTMADARNNLNIMILDACRNNPFARSLFSKRGIKNRKGLALMDVPSGTLIAYATRPNKTALDGTGGRNSPYVKHLKVELLKPGLSILKVLTNVRVAVKKETKNRQAPGFYSELDKEFCFVAPCGQVVAQTSQAAEPPVAPPPTFVPPAAPTLVDRDKDGVADSEDKCPDNTSVEKAKGVDSRGCPLDRDQDKVADYRDECLGTSAGVKVKQNGCPVPPTTSAGKVFRDRLKDGTEGPSMVWIPAGSFRMGDIQGGGYKNEKPVHKVSITQRFAIGRYEVTFAEYDKFVEATGREKPNDRGWGRGNRPVINVSWHDAVAYTEWLSQQTGKKYRLPTEAEWEYAARGGTDTKYWWGNKIGSNKANCSNSYCGDNFKYTAPVGSFAPNQFGLYDTVGNVWEWCADSWHGSYKGAPTDGQVWRGGNESIRVLRGGSWINDPWYARTANRYWVVSDVRFDVYGFRVVSSVAWTP